MLQLLGVAQLIPWRPSRWTTSHIVRSPLTVSPMKLMIRRRTIVCPSERKPRQRPQICAVGRHIRSSRIECHGIPVRQAIPPLHPLNCPLEILMANLHYRRNRKTLARYGADPKIQVQGRNYLSPAFVIPNFRSSSNMPEIRARDIVQHTVTDCSVCASVSVCLEHSRRFKCMVSLSPSFMLNAHEV